MISSIVVLSRLDAALKPATPCTGLEREGRYGEAADLRCEAFDIERRVLGARNPDTQTILDFEAIDLSHMGRYSEAEKRFREAIQAAEEANLPKVAVRRQVAVRRLV